MFRTKRWAKENGFEKKGLLVGLFPVFVFIEDEDTMTLVHRFVPFEWIEEPFLYLYMIVTEALGFEPHFSVKITGNL